MTSNGSDEVNQSPSQAKKARNGVSQKRCSGSMTQGLSTVRKPNRNSHNSMGLKRHRSVDSAAGMLSFNDEWQASKMLIVHQLFFFKSWCSAEKVKGKQWNRKCATTKKYRGYA